MTNRYCWTTLHDAVFVRPTQDILTLLSQPEVKSLINTQNATGWTPLHIAALKNRKDVAIMLINLGASKDIKSYSGYTPLECALQQGNNDMADVLQ